MTHLCLGATFRPTQSIGFLEADFDLICATYAKWQEGLLALRVNPHQLMSTTLAGNDICLRLEKLFPLTTVEPRRAAFVPTKSKWVAFFVNTYPSPDVTGTMSYLAKAIGCRGIRCNYIPAGGKQFPSRIFELYGAEETDFLNYIRTVYAGYDGYSWEFGVTGAVQPFEQVERYSQKEVSDRFTYEMLEAYMRALGLNVFERDFYLHGGVLFERQGKQFGTVREYPLGTITP